MNVYGVDLSLLAQKIQQDLARVSIQVSLKPQSFNVWLTNMDSPGIPLTIGFFAPDYFGSAQYAQYFGMMPDMPWGKRAGVGSQPGLDGVKQKAAYEKALAAVGADQDAAYKDVAMQMIEDKVILPVLSPNLVLAHRNDVTGVRYSACCNLPLGELAKK